LGNLEESRKYFEQSIERAKSDAEQETPAENSEQEPQVENAICVTTNYNLGPIYEGLFLCDKAEKNYKDTLKR
jgi:RNA polymerase-associated protein CTR9